MEVTLTYAQTITLMFMLAIFTAIYGIYYEIRRLQHHILQELDDVDKEREESPVQ